MPPVTFKSLAKLLRDLRPHLGDPHFWNVLYRSLSSQLGASVAIAGADFSFPKTRPNAQPRLVEADIEVWLPNGVPQALEELLRTLIRAHATIGELRGELLAIEDQSSRSARMLSVLAHEIKNPLFAVLGSLELLVQKPMDEDVRKLIETAHASARRMHALVNDSLKLVALEQEGVRLKAQRLSVNGLLEELSAEVATVALASGVHLQVVPLRGDAELLGDRRWLLQALLNLALNAIKYTPEGGRVTLRAVRDRLRTGIEVEDTGPGIAAEDLQRIFEPFQRADTHKEGSGLGLTVVKRIVEAHGGEISVESQPGQGSRFRVELPQLQAEGRGGLAVGMRVLVLTALVGLVLARLPLFPVDVRADTPSGTVDLAQEADLPQGGAVTLGSARMNFDPGSRVRLSARRSLWGGALAASLRVAAGGVAVKRSGVAPRLDVALQHARLRPHGTEFLAQSGENDRVSLFDGALALAGPGFSGELKPGEGAVVSAAGVEKRPLLPAPQVRVRTLEDGRLELRWLPVEGAVAYRIEMSEQGRAVVVARTATPRWVYTPEQNRDLEVRVRALDDLGLAGAASRPQPYRERGAYYKGHRNFLAGDFAQAARWLKRALEVDPTLPEAWYEYGRAQLELGDAPAARKALERAVELEPSYKDRVLLPLAGALEATGDLKGAAEYYRQARSRSQLEREGTLGWIRTQLKMDQYDEAEAAACDWIRDHPDDAAAVTLLKRALEDAGKTYARPGCPLFQQPVSRPRPRPAPPSEPAPKPHPTTAPPESCNPFCK